MGYTTLIEPLGIIGISLMIGAFCGAYWMFLVMYKTEKNLLKELDAKNKYLTPQEGDTNAEILRKISTAYKIEPGSNKAIKQLLKFRNPGKKIYGITKDPSKVKAKDLEIGLNIVTHKGAKTIIEKISETETKIIPFSGI